MNATFNKELGALLIKMGMDENLAPLHAEIMGQIIAKNPHTTTMLLQAIENDNTQVAKDILIELFEATQKWVTNYFNENKDEILQELAEKVWEHFNK